MKGFLRQDLSFSLCGLKCALCPMQLSGHCPGCGGGPGNQPCAIARCSIQHGNPAYCVQCADFPCEKYEDAGKYDSFLSHQGRMQALAQLKHAGPEEYGKEIQARASILHAMLDRYNDGRHKTLFCLAADLLALDSLCSAFRCAEHEPRLQKADKRGKASFMTNLLLEAAARQGVELKLHKRQSSKALPK